MIHGTLATEPNPGTRVIVTGAAGGIGRAVAAHLAAAGCQLGLCDLLDIGNLDPSVDACVVTQRQLDLSDPDWAEPVVSEMVEAMGGCDALVGCAGIVDILHRAERYPLSAWQRDLDVNLTGQFAMVRAVHSALVDSGDARVVLVSSTAAETGLPGQAAYAASKAGLGGLIRTIAAEWAPQGIRCKLVMPGMIDTPKVQHLPDRVRSHMAESIPLGEFGDPANVAGTIAFLLSPAAAYITGATFRVDGGWGLNTSSLATARHKASAADATR